MGCSAGPSTGMTWRSTTASGSRSMPIPTGSGSPGLVTGSPTMPYRLTRPRACAGIRPAPCRSWNGPCRSSPRPAARVPSVYASWTITSGWPVHPTATLPPAPDSCPIVCPDRETHTMRYRGRRYGPQGPRSRRHSPTFLTGLCRGRVWSAVGRNSHYTAPARAPGQPRDVGNRRETRAPAPRSEVSLLPAPPPRPANRPPARPGPGPRPSGLRPGAGRGRGEGRVHRHAGPVTRDGGGRHRRAASPRNPLDRGTGQRPPSAARR
ncbi:hypothetical protein HD595_006259 [Nonomuraea roseoviolacea subsp. carminata]|uniref:Basic proline-rich protein n=1 Tax=Nonomuraea roseoviolacea subsp. carminata TaxID=160689 RepID=A0ABT1K974_9ACTN|nr:hypothetical protein [Nonomuraea roseoviolacea subsp. carminata]